MFKLQRREKRNCNLEMVKIKTIRLCKRVALERHMMETEVCTPADEIDDDFSDPLE